MRVVVLASGTGTLLHSLIDACADGSVAADVVGLVTDRTDAGAIARAHRAGIPTRIVPLTAGTRPGTDERRAWDIRLTDAIAAFQPDLVVLAGFMKLLGPATLDRFARIINTHPGRLPEFPGAHAVDDALAAGVAETAASVIWVDAGVDTGAVIAAEPVPVLPGDDADTLHERIKVVERRLLCQTVHQQSKEPSDA